MKIPIKPALVREVFRQCEETYTVTPEGYAWRGSTRVLRDHIRAVAAEMRERARNLSDLADCGSYNTDEGMLIHDHANELREYADQLEGKERE